MPGEGVRAGTDSTQGSGSRKWIFVLVSGLVLVMVAVYLSGVLDEESASVASIAVKQGAFVISLTLKGGELEAVEAENVVAPKVRGRLKIVEMFPEGEMVEVGDLLVQFEETEFRKRLMDAEQAVEAAQAELVKTTATQEAEIARLEADIKDQEANLRLARLQVERTKFEASIEKNRAEIDAKKAELSYNQSAKKLEAQRVIDGADTRKHVLEISRAEREHEKTKKELEGIIIKADKPGLVVYGKIWKGARPEKVRVGDEVWSGVKILSLPDLSRMQVKTAVNEVDVDKLRVGQETQIKLDALPDPTFHGSITNVAALGREKEREKNVKVFDVTVLLHEQDTRLKPGMTATAEITIETIPPRPTATQLDTAAEVAGGDSARTDTSRPSAVDTAVTAVDSALATATADTAAAVPLPLYIPLDAVFEKDGDTVVYLLRDGHPEEQNVVLGKKNDNYVIVEEGLEVNDRITLRDPTLAMDDIGGIPDEGSEAEALQVE